MPMIERSSGIMIHVTSLPGDHGIGDMGRNSLDFIDFLSNAGQRYWQFLPVGPTSMEFGNSPYMSLSAFAGNPLLIDPEQLREAGLLSDADFAEKPDFSEYFVEFEKVIPYKERLLKIAFEAFKRMGGSLEFDRFCKQEKWLDDYALFMSLREENGQLPWNEWDRSIALREEAAMNKSRKGLAGRIFFHKFVQFCFYDQLDKMRQYAARKGVVLIGDIPIYVGWDSSDVWENQECFKLDEKTLQPTHVAGVPPDYFSDTGQRWGNPIYRWKTRDGCVNMPLYSWWRERFDVTFKIVDIVRIDHFRGFEAYWEIPAKEKTAVKGSWVKGPGIGFFRKMAANVGDLPIIAEDLGVITPEVEKLRDDLGFPGMKILHFAFDSDDNNLYLPHNYTTTNCIVYTGTHDNDTTVGWLYDPDVSPTSKKRAMRYANSLDGNGIHWAFIRMAFSSVAKIAIIPMQDVLGFGTDCRMNRPSTTKRNWVWRCAPRFFSEEICAQLKNETEFYGRFFSFSTTS